MLFNAFPDRGERETFVLGIDAESAFVYGLPSVDPPTLIQLRASVAGVVDTIYDTGLVASAPLFRPASIVLDGTPEARGRGRFQMTGGSTVISLGATAPTARGEPRAYSNFDFIGDVDTEIGNGAIRLRDAVAAIDLPQGLILEGGQTFTTFGDNVALPFSLINDGAPAGAVFQRQAQIRLSRVLTGGWNVALAIENPTNTDFFLPAPSASTDPDRNVRLQRYPDIVGRIQWVRPTGEKYEVDRIYVASMVRGIGYQDAADTEHFVTGWGVAGATRFRVYGEDNVQLGAVVGEGLGNYLFGFGGTTQMVSQTAAGPNTANELTAIKQVGAHIGYQHFFSQRLAGNLGYGYAFADTTAEMVGVAKQTQNAWTNLVLKVNEKFHIGLEYHYGLLEVTESTQGTNSRIQMTMILAK